MVTLPTFHTWLATANPNSTHTYYYGNLAADRGALEIFPAKGVRTPALDDADAAWTASIHGLVTLVQRAIGPILPNGTHTAFEYIAQRTKG